MARKTQAKRTQNASVQSHRARYIALGLGALMSVMLVGAIAMWLSEPQNLPVRVIRVQGELQQVSQQDVREVVLPYVQQGFLRIDIAAVRTSLEQMPWVHSAEVRRTWPDVLQVSLREQQVLALWGEGGLVNPDGDLFRPVETVIADGLPVLRGPQGTSMMLAAHFIELQRALTQLGLTITDVTMDERRAWKITLNNGVELMLGRSEHPERVARFVRAYARILGPRIDTVARVDLRYTNGFSVQWRGTNRAGA